MRRLTPGVHAGQSTTPPGPPRDLCSWVQFGFALGLESVSPPPGVAVAPFQGGGTGSNPVRGHRLVHSGYGVAEAPVHPSPLRGPRARSGRDSAGGRPGARARPGGRRSRRVGRRAPWRCRCRDAAAAAGSMRPIPSAGSSRVPSATTESNRGEAVAASCSGPRRSAGSSPRSRTVWPGRKVSSCRAQAGARQGRTGSLPGAAPRARGARARRRRRWAIGVVHVHLGLGHHLVAAGGRVGEGGRDRAVAGGPLDRPPGVRACSAASPLRATAMARARRSAS